MHSKPKTISEYINNLSSTQAQKKLKKMLGIARKAAPKAEKGIKWGMPALSYNRVLVMFGAFKNHVSLFPTGSVLNNFTKEVKNYKTSRGTIQFPLNKPLPKTLIKKIVVFRVKQATLQDKRWRPKK